MIEFDVFKLRGDQLAHNSHKHEVAQLLRETLQVSFIPATR